MTTRPQTPVLEPIPQPPPKPSIGNREDIKLHAMVESLSRLSRIYGPLFKLDLPGHQMVVAANYEFANELCDEKRFGKKGSFNLRAVQKVLPTSVFVVPTDEPIWSKAHNIMLPLFGTQAVKSYVPKMWEETIQMILKWENLNPDDEIDVSDNMIRLTTDIIGRCCFSYRFNSFYRETSPPIIQALMRSLEEAVYGQQSFSSHTQAAIDEKHRTTLDATYLRHAIDEIIRERIAAGVGKQQDMLDQLLVGYDKKTGEKFSGSELTDQVVTLLFAGHITTSSLLSFALYELMRHPGIMVKAYDEVDRVLGNTIARPPSSTQISQLQYLAQILKETLRLHPPAPRFVVNALKEEETLGNRYRVTAEQDLTVLTAMLHRDPAVWGATADIFNPDRFLPDAEAKIPANAYKPFGNGQRACLGRPFAMQEATVALSMLLQYFDFIDSTGYQLQTVEMPNPKPANFKIQVKRRAHMQSILPRWTEVQPSSPPVSSSPVQTPEAPPAGESVSPKAPNIPLVVLFGSNLGTSEALANQIGNDGRERGFVTTVNALDQAFENLDQRPGELAVVIIVSSYNGNPPDNATKFYEWLQNPNLPKDVLKGVHYAVFGCGNKQWASTYQAVPTFFDQAFEKHGAQRMYPFGTGDANGDFDGMFQSWYQQLWPSTAQAFSLPLEKQTPVPPIGPQYSLEIAQGELTPSPYISSYGAIPLVLLSNHELQNQDSPAPRSTRSIEAKLSADMRYHAGDHLGILAYNTSEEVERVLRRFGCNDMTTVRIHKNDTRRTPLPVGQYIRLSSILKAYVELHEVATRSQIKRLIEYTELPTEQDHLRSFIGEDQESEQRYKQEVLGKHLSLIDVLESHPSCDVPLGIFLEFLSPIRPRYYSISSSPLVTSSTCRITVGVLEEKALSGHGIYRGTCSSFLSRRKPDETIYGFVQNIKSPFHLPEDSALPMIMVSAGTGLAPFMGFLQERSMLKEQGKPVGPSLLFFGCRRPDQDFIYKDELEEYARQGITEIQVAFSREKADKRIYVQDKLLEQQDKVWDYIQQGASTFICGDLETMVPAVGQSYRTIYQHKQNVSDEEAKKWLEDMTNAQRYVVDIWGTTKAVY